MQSATNILSSPYETASIINQYLLFHYGNAQEQLPYSFGPHTSLNFPERCVHESLKGLTFTPEARALDLGCATGRGSFELAGYFDHVDAIDNSKRFIETAKQLQKEGTLPYEVLEEGERYSKHIASVPSGIEAHKVNFLCDDALEFLKKEARYDLVLAANLICRLPNPSLFLESIHLILKEEGVFILASPYSWLEEFTPRHHWLGTENRSSFESLQKILGSEFNLQRTFDLPFLIREHARKYQWGVSQISLWKKR